MALDKESKAEVAARTADTDKDSATAHEKVFVLLRRDWDEMDDARKETQHIANKAAVRQYMATQGLRTDKDVEYVGEEDVPSDSPDLPDRKRSVGLRYKVSAWPARVDEDTNMEFQQVVPEETALAVGETPLPKREEED